MNTIRAATVIALLAAACGSPQPAPEAPADAGQPTTTRAIPQLITTTTTHAEEREAGESDMVEVSECPEGTHSREDGGECHPDLAEDTPTSEEVAEVAEGEVMVNEDVAAAETCQAEGGSWDADTERCALPEVQDPPREPEEPPNGPEVTEEPEEEPGGIVTGPDPSRGVVADWWSPGLGDEALALVDPHAVGADNWHLIEEERPWGTYRWYRFYHGLMEDTAEERGAFWDAITVARELHSQESSDVYFPYRFDVAWAEHPDLISVTATFPRGETVLVPVQRGPMFWWAKELPRWPSAPPIRPTTPFAEPRFPDTAQALGRDCLPVEELWEREKEVTDPCTISAVQTALEYAFLAPKELGVAAIRDGHVLTETLQAVETSDDRCLNEMQWPTVDRRPEVPIEIESARWAARWAQASMIRVSYRFDLGAPRRPNEWQLACLRDLVQRAADAGEDVGHYPDFSSFEFPRFGSWHSLLVVRTADGTWRVSYRSFCIRFDGSVRRYGIHCPADPTPWFPDSLLFDAERFPPSSVHYYFDSRGRSMEEGYLDHPTFRVERGDFASTRLAGEYLGVPPS